MTEIKKIIRNSSQAAFTLIEMLVVVFVVGIGLVGALSFFNINLNNQFEAKNELIAAGLAQESSDLVRNIVDYNALNEYLWYEDIYDKTTTALCSSIDRDNVAGADKFKCKSKPKSETVCFDSVNGFYYQAKNTGNCGANKITDFERRIVISRPAGDIVDLDSGGCLQIVVTVTWNKRVTKSQDIICKPRQ